MLQEASGPRALTLLATGSEVQIAVAARATLEAEGVPTAVVSLPCWELFDRQDAAWRAQVLGTAPRLAVEAASTLGWTRYVDSEDDVLGMRGFGASAPIDALYAQFGITAGHLVDMARARLARQERLEQHADRSGERHMALISLRQLLDHAAEHGYGVPAFNINNMEQLLGIMAAARRTDAPVIVQASRGARAYAGDIMLRRMVRGGDRDQSRHSGVSAPGPRGIAGYLLLGHPERVFLAS